MIYVAYVLEDDGYFYDFRSGKLTAAGGRRIDLSLMLTCAQVANEMRGLALGTNLVTFSTVYDGNLRKTAGQFDFLMQNLTHSLRLLLEKMQGPPTPTMLEQLEVENPHFKPCFERIRNKESDIIREAWISSWCGISSLHFDFIQSTMRLLAAHQHTISFSQQDLRRLQDRGPQTVDDVLSLQYPRWSIPTQTHISTLRDALRPTKEEWEEWEEMSDRVKYRISAAASAIHFLQGLSASSRLELRRLCVYEDFSSVSYPECHSRGFIPFCKENRELRVNRRVCLWRSIFPSKEIPDLVRLAEVTDDDRRERQWDKLAAYRVSSLVNDWAMEADVLPLLGMPPNSFSVTLDGSLLPARSTEVFDTIQGDAAWQLALQESVSRGILPAESYLETIDSACFISDDFPRVIRAISAGSSSIRCNFDCGQPYDIENIIEKHRGWSWDDWLDGWYERNNDRWFDTAPELPNWVDFRLEELLPDESPRCEG